MPCSLDPVEGLSVDLLDKHTVSELVSTPLIIEGHHVEYSAPPKLL